MPVSQQWKKYEEKNNIHCKPAILKKSRPILLAGFQQTVFHGLVDILQNVCRFYFLRLLQKNRFLDHLSGGKRWVGWLLIIFEKRGRNHDRDVTQQLPNSVNSPPLFTRWVHVFYRRRFRRICSIKQFYWLTDWLRFEMSEMEISAELRDKPGDARCQKPFLFSFPHKSDFSCLQFITLHLRRFLSGARSKKIIASYFRESRSCEDKWRRPIFFFWGGEVGWLFWFRTGELLRPWKGRSRIRGSEVQNIAIHRNTAKADERRKYPRTKPAQN